MKPSLSQTDGSRIQTKPTMQTGNNPPENYFVQARIPYFKEQAFKVTSQEPLFRKIIATWGEHAQVKLIDILEGEYGQVVTSSPS